MRMKRALKTGDIIVNRAGYLGVVLKDEDRILYQELGMDLLHEFNDDLMFFDFYDKENRDFDIMQVFRGCSFITLEDNKPYWERDRHWVPPTVEERRERDAQMEQKRQEQLEEMRMVEDDRQNQAAENRKNQIYIVSQCFYGNRTGTEIDRDWVDHFLRGHLSRELFGPKDIQDVVRKTVCVPGSEHIVIVYDQTQEDRYVFEDFPKHYARDGAEYLERWGEELKMHVSCEIPEIGFKIHTRCFACRMDDNEMLQSLEDSDCDKFIHYFPAK